MSSPVTLRFDSNVSECGDVISGVVSVVDDSVAVSSSVEVRLVATVRAREATSSTAPSTVTAGRAVLSADTPMVFEIPVPVGGPISFDGATMSASWTVEVSTSGSTSALLRQDVTILPAGGLAVWARRDAPPPQQPHSQA